MTTTKMSIQMPEAPEAPEAQVVLTLTDLDMRLIREQIEMYAADFSYEMTESWHFQGHTYHQTHVGMPESVYLALAAEVGPALEVSYCYLIQKDDWQHEHERRFGWEQLPGGEWICMGFTSDPMIFSQSGVCGETMNTHETGEIAEGHCGATVLASSRKHVKCPHCGEWVYLT